MKKLSLIDKYLIGIFISTSLLYAEDVAPKTVSLRIDKNKNIDVLFDQVYEAFQTLVKKGELKNAAYGEATLHKKVIDFQTQTDDIDEGTKEAKNAAAHVREILNSNHQPYSAKVTVLKSNLFFGDKSQAYALNPYKGCLKTDLLANRLEIAGYKLVDETKDADLILNIGILACITQTEFANFRESEGKYKGTIPSQNTSQTITGDAGKELMNTGAQVQLSTPQGGGNAGMAVMGAGLALNLLSAFIPNSIQEKDIVRYQVTMIRKGEKPFTYYPMALSDGTHGIEKSIGYSASSILENVILNDFKVWDKHNEIFMKSMPSFLLEKDLQKAIRMTLEAQK